MNITPKQEYLPLTPNAFYVLLALAEKPMYGYGMFEQIEFDTERTLGPDRASIYRTMHRLHRLHLVEPAFEDTSQGSPHDRHYYRLSANGRAVLEWEAERYRSAANLATSRLARTANHETIAV